MPNADAPRFSKLLGRASCWRLAGDAAGTARDKWSAIGEMIDRLVANGRIPAARRDAVHAAVVERERSMSTGMERGIALPHAAVDGLDDLVTALAVFHPGVPFQSIDGAPARIVVLLLIPRERRLAYLPVLADAARLLSRDEVREKLLAAPSDGALHDAITAAESLSPGA